MTNDKSPFDASAAVTAAFDLVIAAKADLLEWLNIYNTTGRELAETTRDRLRQLNDPPVSPVRTDVVDNLTRELTAFGQLWLPLVSNAGLLLFDLDIALNGLAVRMMSVTPALPADTEYQDMTAMALALMDAGTDAQRRRELIMASAAVAAKSVAETVQEVASLLIARLNLLTALIRRTDQTPPSATAPPTWFVRTIGKVVTNEAALVAAEELLTTAAQATIRELPKHVPVGGILVSIITVPLDVHKELQALRERRELLERAAAAYFEPNVIEDMSILFAQFRRDDERIEKFFPRIDNLIHDLNSDRAE